MMIGRMHHLIIDCPDPAALAAFYSELIGQPVTYSSPDFVVVAANDRTSGLGFQLAPGNRAPTWPDETVPQQFHLDVMVDDLDEAAERVLAIGARRLEPNNADQHAHVFADPAGHPFCLIPRPGWAPPVGASR
jgi:catechol 2,3-dioxygenase-like lactoylglutathione lyase family enzyme